MIMRRAFPTISPIRVRQSGLRTATPVNMPRTATPAAPFNNPTSPPTGGSPPANPSDPGGSPWDADPILQQIKAQATSNIAQAEAASLAQRQRALIQFGYDPTLQSLYGDANTSAAAQKNPFSILANMLRDHTKNQLGINEGYNKQNLFYSGHRGQALQEEGTNYLGQVSSAENALQSLLSGLDTNLLNYKQGQQDRIVQGSQDAYNRWLSAHPTLPSPGSPGAPAIQPTPVSPNLGNLRTMLKRRY